MSHLLPEGGANRLPSDFKINSLLELRKELTIRKSDYKTCPKHNDPLRVYCETCRKVICACCTISEEHNKHHLSCKLISDCYPKHHQKICEDLDLLKQKTANMHTAITGLITREREVLQQGEEVKKQIHIHAQQLINQIQRSERHILQEVDTVVQKKIKLLTRQREQAERVHTQLKTCQDMVEQSLKEWSQLHVMTEKEIMLYQMNTISQDVDPTVFQPIEEANTKFAQTSNIRNGIGKISSHRYEKATLEKAPCYPSNTPSTATLTLQSHDGSPFSLPPSFISCKLFSSGDSRRIKCDINQTQQQGKYNISFTPTTTGEHQLIVQVGGVDISGTPIILPVTSSMMMRREPVKAITGLKGPRGIAVCSNGDIVVAENGTHCVTIVNKEEKKVRSFGAEGTKEGQFVYPYGVAVSNDGHILVTDRHRIQKLTFNGICVKAVGSKNDGSGPLQLNDPGGITVHHTTGQIFVADGNNKRIQVFSNDLSFSHTITLRGDKPYPRDVSLDCEGHLYVADYGNNCITKYTTAGLFITRFGSCGSSPGQLYRPSSLTIKYNLVYVSEYGSNRVSVFDTEGSFLYCFGKRGNGKGEFNYPSGITTDTNGNLYVSDTYNNRLAIF